MKNNDLSNQIGATFAFRCEDCLLTFKESSLIDKALNFIVGKEKRAEINPEVYRAMEYIYRNTEYCVDLIVEKKNYTAELRELLDTLPFNRILLIDKEVEITLRLNSNDISYYVDVDNERRHAVNHKYAIDLQTMYLITRGR